jgi:class 3 adenylate cyclase
MKKVNIFDMILVYCLPQVLLEGTPWLTAWKERERKDFETLARIFFPLSAVLYAAHYFLFDRPMELEPSEHWLKFRVSMAALSTAAFIFYLSPLSRGPFYRLPAVIASLAFCYSQARVTVWYPEAPWLYCFLFVGICTLVLRTSLLKSLLFAAAAIFLQVPSLIESGVPEPTLASAVFVTMILIVASRSGYVGDIRYFLLNQQNIDTQRKNIELNIEFTDRIKSFIPGEIARRLDLFLQNRNATVLQAIDEVLRPRKRQIACLFSDIRGFTEASKELDTFIGDLVLPNVKACTSAIDESGGVPRKIGDLVFAYFDDPNPRVNLLNALMAAIKIAEINKLQNAHNDGNKKISRYILIAVGEAIVGNIGGFDSSVEITALGSPVNLLSRIDELTKHKLLADSLESEDIVLSNSAFEMLVELGLMPRTKKVDLKALRLEIRNFPEERFIYKLSPTEENVRHIAAFCRLLKEHNHQESDDRTVEAA